MPVASDISVARNLEAFLHLEARAGAHHRGGRGPGSQPLPRPWLAAPASQKAAPAGRASGCQMVVWLMLRVPSKLITQMDQTGTCELEPGPTLSLFLRHHMFKTSLQTSYRVYQPTRRKGLFPAKPA